MTAPRQTGLALIAAMLAAGSLAAAANPSASGNAPAPASAMPAGSSSSAASSGSSHPAVSGPSCIERIPEGKSRPQVTEKFPSHATSGHVATLEVVVPHGKGESVLPSGIRLQASGEAVRAIEHAGFIIPSPDGTAPPKMIDKAIGDRVETKVRIPFVPLPPKAGRATLTLPPVPITLQRASGDLVTVCTAPHEVVVDDPTANTPNPDPRKNPAPRRQNEVWKLAKTVAGVGLIALVVGGLLAWLIGKWIRRPRPVAPPPPPRPPWEVAMEELFDIRHAGLIKAERFSDHFDRVSNAIRKYLGDRFGFDGLECTTRETMTLLRDVRPQIAVMEFISGFLRQADLVKFARLTPSAEECTQALDLGEQIVQRTVPAPGEQTLVPVAETPEDDADDEVALGAAISSVRAVQQPDTSVTAGAAEPETVDSVPPAELAPATRDSKPPEGGAA